MLTLSLTRANASKPIDDVDMFREKHLSVMLDLELLPFDSICGFPKLNDSVVWRDLRRYMGRYMGIHIFPTE